RLSGIDSLITRTSFTFFFPGSGAHHDLHSFPTRRSSDLGVWRCRDTIRRPALHRSGRRGGRRARGARAGRRRSTRPPTRVLPRGDRKSTRLNSSHLVISYAVFCLKKKKKQSTNTTGI